MIKLLFKRNLDYVVLALGILTVVGIIMNAMEWIGFRTEYLLLLLLTIVVYFIMTRGKPEQNLVLLGLKSNVLVFVMTMLVVLMVLLNVVEYIRFY